MDFFTELKYESRISKVKNFSLNYWKYLILLAVTLFVAFAAYSWYDFKVADNLAKDAAFYHEAMISRNKEKQINILEKLTGSSSFYSNLSNLKLSELYNEQQDFKKAIFYLKQVQSQSKEKSLLNSYTKLLLIKTKLHSGQISNKQAIEQLNDFIQLDTRFNNIARVYLLSSYITENDIENATKQLDFLKTKQKFELFF